MYSFEQITKNKEYRERIMKYFRFPMRLTISEEKFNSYIEFLKRNEPLKCQKIISTVEEEFNRLAQEQKTENPDFTFEDILEHITKDLTSHPNWELFLNEDYSKVLEGYKGETSPHGLYKQDNDGKFFLSIDLEAANWQSLQHIIGFKETYEELILKYTDYKIPLESKTFRTKISGVMGQKQIIDFNKHLLKSKNNKICKVLSEMTNLSLVKEPYAIYADEFLLEISEEDFNILNAHNKEELKAKLLQETGLSLHIRPFKLKWLGIEKSCAKISSKGYEILNISKDILYLINKIRLNEKIEDIDFEGIKLKDRTKEEYISDLASKVAVL